MTSSVDDRTRNVARFVNPSVAVLVPFLFLMLLYNVMLAPLFARSAVMLVFVPILLLAVGIIEYSIGWWLKTERLSGAGPVLRELVVTLFASGLILLIIKGKILSPLAGLSDPELWIVLALILFQWVLTGSFRRRMRQRELFLELFSEKRNQDFRVVYRDYGQEAGEVLGSLRKLRGQIVWLLLLTFVVLVVIHWTLRLPVTALEFCGTALYFAASLVAIRSLGSLALEQLALVDGVRHTSVQITLGAAIAIPLLAAICILALPVSGPHALLSESLLVRFWQWLVALLGSLFHGTSSLPAPRPSPVQQNMSAVREALLQGNPAAPPAWLAVLGQILRAAGWAVLAAAAGGAIFFLVRPLFRVRPGRDAGGSLLRSALRYIGELAHLAALRIRFFFAMLAGRAPYKAGRPGQGGRNARRDDRYGEEESGAYGDAASKRGRDLVPIGLFLRAFRRLTRWGERRGARFSPTLAPREYAESLARAEPAVGELVDEIAEIFEEALYSGRRISDERLSSYFRTIRIVTRTRRK